MESVCAKCRGLAVLYANPRTGKRDSWCRGCKNTRSKEKYQSDPAYAARCRRYADDQRVRNAGNLRSIVDHMLRTAKSNAKCTGVPFELTVDDVLPLIDRGICPVFGRPFELRTKVTDRKRNPWGPSLDQLRPRAGYTKTNVRVISQRANCVKSNASADELEAIARWMRREQAA